MGHFATHTDDDTGGGVRPPPRNCYLHPNTVRLPCHPNTTLLLLRGCRAPSLDCRLHPTELCLLSCDNTAVRGFEVALVHPTLFLRASVRLLQCVRCARVLPTHHAFGCCCELHSSSSSSCLFCRSTRVQQSTCCFRHCPAALRATDSTHAQRSGGYAVVYLCHASTSSLHLPVQASFPFSIREE